MAEVRLSVWGERAGCVAAAPRAVAVKMLDKGEIVYIHSQGAFAVSAADVLGAAETRSDNDSFALVCARLHGAVDRTRRADRAAQYFSDGRPPLYHRVLTANASWDRSVLLAWMNKLAGRAAPAVSAAADDSDDEDTLPPPPPPPPPAAERPLAEEMRLPELHELGVVVEEGRPPIGFVAHAFAARAPSAELGTPSSQLRPH
jgi:hypothetical protein